ncbi:MAG: D-alanyl-D-alanine carboxypeptidase family protein [Patescibacteria group bacterium]
MKFQTKEIEVLEKILKKFSSLKRRSRGKVVLMDYRVFLFLLDFEEKKLIKKIQNLNISKYGKKTPFYGIKRTPEDLVAVRGQKYKNKGIIRHLPVSFLPGEVYGAFKKMNQAIKKETGKSFLIKSGYRSPAYQMIVFLGYLEKNFWNIKKTMKGVALPGYSEHGCPGKQAVDFTSIEILKKNKRDFSQTEEYRWLKKNAAKFGFYLSFPKDNKLGVKFEPWHWHYESSPEQCSGKLLTIK